MSDVQVVLGATGGIGGAVVAVLTASGATVRAVSTSGRRPWSAPGEQARLELVAADVSSPEGAARAVEGASCVYHCAQPDYPRWAAQFPPLTAAVADAAASVGARLVMADNLYMYGPVSGPIGEDSPTQPTSGKGQVRRRMAEDLLDRHRRGQLEVVLGRASDYYGPGGRGSTPGALVFAPLAKGRSARWMGRLDQPHSLHYLPDVGRALVALGNADSDVTGRAWILPAAPARTGAEWIAAAYAAAGRSGAPKVVSPLQNRIAGVFVPMVRELNEIMDQFTEPFVADDSAFLERFGGEGWVTPVPEAMTETVRWFGADVHVS